NTAAYIKEKEFGIAIMDKRQVTTKNLVNAIEEVLRPNNKYLQNTLKYSKILKANQNPRQVFNYWLDYGLKYGYKHLIVKAYDNLYFFQVYGLDVYLALIAILFLVYYVVKKILICIFCSCKVK